MAIEISSESIPGTERRRAARAAAAGTVVAVVVVPIVGAWVRSVLTRLASTKSG